MSIGQRIKIAREQRNMTLDEVAKHCGTTRQTIFKYENDIVTNIPYDRIVLLSTTLGVTPSYLFGWEEKEKAPTERQLSEGQRLLLDLYDQLPEDKQRMFIEMLRAAAKAL